MSGGASPPSEEDLLCAQMGFANRFANLRGVTYGFIVLNYWGEGEDIQAVLQRGDCGRPFFLRSFSN
jgi:hypothetical protein